MDMRKGILMVRQLLTMTMIVVCWVGASPTPTRGQTPGHMLLAGADVPLVVCQTWDAAHKGTHVVLSSADLRYSTIAAINKGTVCGTLNKTSGDWYFEVKSTDPGAGASIGIVVSNTLFNTNNYLGLDNYGYGYYSLNGGYFHHGGTNFFTFPGTYGAGVHYIGIEVHMNGASSTFEPFLDGVSQGAQTINITSMYAAGSGQTAAGELQMPAPVYASPHSFPYLCN